MVPHCHRLPRQSFIEIDFWTVESAVAGLDLIGNFFRQAHPGRLRRPRLKGCRCVSGLGPTAPCNSESEGAIDVDDEVDDAVDFAFDLISRQNVAVVLSKLTYAEQPLKRPFFMPMNQTEFAIFKEEDSRYEFGEFR